MFDGSLLNSLLLVPANDLSKIGTVILCSSVIRNKRLLDLNSNFKYFGYVSKYNALCVNFRIEKSIRLLIGNQPRHLLFDNIFSAQMNHRHFEVSEFGLRTVVVRGRIESCSNLS